MSSAAGVTQVIIDGKNNFTGSPAGLAKVSRPVQEAASAAASASSGNLAVIAQFDKQVASRVEAGPSSSVSVSMEPAKLVSSSSQQGFEFKVPPRALPKLNGFLMQTKDGTSKSVTLTATLANGMPLPDWLKFDPETQTFSSSAVPNGAPDLQVRIQASQNGQLIDAVTFTIDLP